MTSFSFKYFRISVMIFMFLSPVAYSQDAYQNNNSDIINILFYNVENLFDTIDDPSTKDEEFTPEGMRRWNSYKYYRKLNHLYKVIALAGGWNQIDLMGLAEIENHGVIEDLFQNTPLWSENYSIIHKDSEDRRGIDVGFGFREDVFRLISYEWIQIQMEKDTSFRTRDILHVEGFVFDTIGLHVFINHWPSRYGGYMSSVPKRIAAAITLRSAIDTVFSTDQFANIVVVGDFNDEAEDESMLILSGDDISDTVQANGNLNLISKEGQGSLKYQGRWFGFDHILVSGALIDGTNGLKLIVSGNTVVKENFMLTRDDAYLGGRPKRTYYGMKYEGGFSDHFPVLIRIFKARNDD